MRVFAPGKLVILGAYAVLGGAPSVVVAVDRGAVAGGPRVAGAHVGPELAAAMAAEPGAPEAPAVDTRAMFEGGAKLGLGASAASVVAALGLLDATRGADLTSATTRASLFARARAAHAAAQGGGSGVDVAASVHGGALVYTVASDVAEATPLALAPELVLTAYFAGRSASTPALRARVDALRARDPAAHARATDRVASAARAGIAGARAADAFVAAVRASATALAELGDAADAPIVPAAARELGDAAARDGASFTPAGAGGGDVMVHVGASAPTPAFEAAARERGFSRVELGLDALGVRLVDGRAGERSAAVASEGGVKT